MNTLPAFDSLDRRDLSYGGRDFSVFGLPDDDYFLTIESFAAANSIYIGELRKIAEEAPTIIDVGANIGVTCALASMIHPKARVVAVEPSRKARGCLEQMRQFNGLADQIEVVAAGLGPKRGEIKLFEAQFLAGSHQIRDGYGSEAGQTITAPVLTLDELVKSRGLTRVDLIKIDVEGFELGVLQGARKTIQRFSPPIIMEFNSWTITAWANQSPRALLDYVLATFGGFSYEVAGVTHDVTDQDGLLRFLHMNLTMHGCVDDIIIRPQRGPVSGWRRLLGA